MQKFTEYQSITPADRRRVLEEQEDEIAKCENAVRKAREARDVYAAKLKAGTLPRHEWKPLQKMESLEHAVKKAESKVKTAKGLHTTFEILSWVQIANDRALLAKEAKLEREKEERLAENKRRFAAEMQLLRDEADRKRHIFEQDAKQVCGLNIVEMRCTAHSVNITLSNGAKISADIENHKPGRENFGLSIFAAGKLVDYQDFNEKKYGGKIKSISFVDEDSDNIAQKSLIIRTTKRKYQFCLFNDYDCEHSHKYAIHVGDAFTGGDL